MGGPAQAGHYVPNQRVRLKPDATYYVYFGCAGGGLVGGAGDGVAGVPVDRAGAGARGALDGGGPAVPLTIDPGPR